MCEMKSSQSRRKLQWQEARLFFMEWWIAVAVVKDTQVETNYINLF